PAAFVRDFDVAREGARFAAFIYRFNRPPDLVAFCVAARDALARHGTLEKCFLAGDADPRGALAPALERFARAFLDADLREVFPRGRRSRGYRHLFPLPSAGGPCKRLLLVLTVVAWALFGTRRELAELRTRPPASDPALPLLKQEIDGVRREGREDQERLRREVASLTTEVTRQLEQGMKLIQAGQSSIGERLDAATKVVGDVQGSLGTLQEATRRVAEIGREIQ